MKHIKNTICFLASPIYILRYGIGSQRFSIGLLDNENESSIEKQALSLVFERIFFSIGSILFQLTFLTISFVFDQQRDSSFLKWTIYITLLIHILYHLYYTFYAIRKQNLTEDGKPIFANLILPYLFKGICTLLPKTKVTKVMQRYNGFTAHTSNLYIGIVWLSIGYILYKQGMYISGVMILISLICFGIISLNFFVSETENIRSQLVGKQKDRKLNNTKSQKELSLPEKEKIQQKTLISSPL